MFWGDYSWDYYTPQLLWSQLAATCWAYYFSIHSILFLVCYTHAPRIRAQWVEYHLILLFFFSFSDCFVTNYVTLWLQHFFAARYIGFTLTHTHTNTNTQYFMYYSCPSLPIVSSNIKPFRFTTHFFTFLGFYSFFLPLFLDYRIVCCTHFNTNCH